MEIAPSPCDHHDGEYDKEPGSMGLHEYPVSIRPRDWSKGT
jgi:hypothetical protein